VDANRAAGVDTAERDFLPADGDHTGGADPALNDPVRSVAVVAGRRASALQAQRLPAHERVGTDAQQLAGLAVQDHQRLGLDADDHRPAAEDLGGQDLLAGETDEPAVVDRLVDLDRRILLLERRAAGGPGSRARPRARRDRRC
jgi:hypothetical protein